MHGFCVNTVEALEGLPYPRPEIFPLVVDVFELLEFNLKGTFGLGLVMLLRCDCFSAKWMVNLTCCGFDFNFIVH